MSDDALLPVLVAELADAGARLQVEKLASERATAIVPLVDAPVDASLHVLEVTTPDADEPLLVLAEPVGAPTAEGFPLRLHPYGSPPQTTSLRPPTDSLPSFKARRDRPTTLTRHHTLDLLGEPRPEAPPAKTEDLVGRTIADKLLIEELVGVGGMGAVYRARHKQLKTLVAVKVLHERFREDLTFCARFHAEALVVSQLDHTNVVRVLDYGQEADGLLYLAMDFLSGIELGEVLAQEGTLPLPRIVDLAMQVSAGLGHAHGRGIIHRDVKPSNIVLVRTENDEGKLVEVVKVCDFGIAARTGTTDFVGTPAYMSPEQCACGPGRLRPGVASETIDARSDIYALGVILYELATGQLPFSHDDPERVVEMQLHEAPPPPSAIRAVDKRLEKLVMSMLAKSPAERPRTMRELRGHLRGLLRPPSLDLHDVGAGRTDRGSAPPPPARPPMPEHASSVTRLPVVIDARALAKALIHEPVSALRERLATPERFIAEAQALATAMRLLLEQREHAALAHVVTLFRKAATDPSEDARTVLAARLVRTLQDPALLAGVAEQALAEHDESAPALLASLGLAAAHALYNARVRAHATPPVRGRFVSTMRAIGGASWPLMAAALQRNAPGDAASHDHRLAEDLLRATPMQVDDATGGVVAKYLRWGDAAVRRAAIPPLVSLWADRAKPLLLAVLQKDVDEGARLAALKGLRDLRAIDEHVLRKVEEILLSDTAGAAIRVAAAETMGDAIEEARPLATGMLKRALTPRGGVFGLGKKAPSLPGKILLSAARSFALLAGAEAPPLVEELARQSEEPLRTQLLGVVGGKI
ncbi:MAG: serine/threonine protein kinase [Labilithrix sp.]|nr:serine/threonine protein kinase [Labilithrix sp.]